MFPRPFLELIQRVSFYSLPRRSGVRAWYRRVVGVRQICRYVVHAADQIQAVPGRADREQHSTRCYMSASPLRTRPEESASRILFQRTKLRLCWQYSTAATTVFEIESIRSSVELHCCTPVDLSITLVAKLAPTAESRYATNDLEGQPRV